MSFFSLICFLLWNLNCIIIIQLNLDPSGEISDTEEYEVKEAAIEGDRHSVVMSLLSQVKLGTDLTNVRK